MNFCSSAGVQVVANRGRCGGCWQQHKVASDKAKGDVLRAKVRKVSARRGRDARRIEEQEKQATQGLHRKFPRTAKRPAVSPPIAHEPAFRCTSLSMSTGAWVESGLKGCWISVIDGNSRPRYLLPEICGSPRGTDRRVSWRGPNSAHMVEHAASKKTKISGPPAMTSSENGSGWLLTRWRKPPGFARRVPRTKLVGE